MADADSKTCTKCDEQKPSTDFKYLEVRHRTRD